MFNEDCVCLTHDKGKPGFIESTKKRCRSRTPTHMDESRKFNDHSPVRRCGHNGGGMTRPEQPESEKLAR